MGKAEIDVESTITQAEANHPAPHSGPKRRGCVHAKSKEGDSADHFKGKRNGHKKQKQDGPQVGCDGPAPCIILKKSLNRKIAHVSGRRERDGENWVLSGVKKCGKKESLKVLKSKNDGLHQQKDTC